MAGKPFQSHKLVPYKSFVLLNLPPPIYEMAKQMTEATGLTYWQLTIFALEVLSVTHDDPEGLKGLLNKGFFQANVERVKGEYPHKNAPR